MKSCEEFHKSIDFYSLNYIIKPVKIKNYILYFSLS